MLGKAKAAEVFRTLVDQVMMVPDNGELAIILRGDLAAILRFVAGKKNPDILTEAGVMAKLLSQGSLVAGSRSHHDLRQIEQLACQVKAVAGDRNHHDLLFRTAA